MSTGTEHTAPRALDNNNLADALVTLAGLLRLNADLPPVFSVNVSVGDREAGTWEAQIHPSGSGEEYCVDAIRAFAAAFGSEATLHLGEPQVGTRSGTYRQLAARGTRDGLCLEAWAFIARTPAKGDA